MLVLSRRVNEKIVFPELEVVLEIIRTQGNQVRIGITAPDQVRILRGELMPPTEMTAQDDSMMRDSNRPANQKNVVAV